MTYSFRCTAMNTESVITVDLHEKSVFQARIAIEAALRRAGGAYRLRVIHGSNQGSALKRLVWDEYQSDPRVIRLSAVNDGCTELVLREL